MMKKIIVALLLAGMLLLAGCQNAATETTSCIGTMPSTTAESTPQTHTTTEMTVAESTTSTETTTTITESSTSTGSNQKIEEPLTADDIPYLKYEVEWNDQNHYWIDGLAYYFNDVRQSFTVIDYNTIRPYFIIASEINGYPVEAIGIGAFEEMYESSFPQVGKKYLRTVYIPDTVIYIEASAFNECRTLQRIVGGRNVTTIEGSAFFGCTSLEEINFPSAKTIGNNAFYSCKKAEKAFLPSVTEAGKNALTHCSKLQYADISSLNAISESMFFCCMELTEVKLSPNLEAIHYMGFNDCYNLVSIELPETVTYIGKSAFSDCRSLTEFTIPSQVTTLSELMFYDCNNLQRLEIPKGATQIYPSVIRMDSQTMTFVMHEETYQAISQSSPIFIKNCEEYPNITIEIIP